MRRRLGPSPRQPNRQTTIAVNEFQSWRNIARVSAGARRALEGLLIGVERRGAVLPDDVVAEIDEGEPDEFGNVEYLHIAETGEGSTDARKQRADGNEDVAEEPGPSGLDREILDR